MLCCHLLCTGGDIKGMKAELHFVLQPNLHSFNMASCISGYEGKAAEHLGLLCTVYVFIGYLIPLILQRQTFQSCIKANVTSAIDGFGVI